MPEIMKPEPYDPGRPQGGPPITIMIGSQSEAKHGFPVILGRRDASEGGNCGCVEMDNPHPFPLCNLGWHHDDPLAEVDVAQFHRQQLPLAHSSIKRKFDQWPK